MKQMKLIKHSLVIFCIGVHFNLQATVKFGPNFHENTELNVESSFITKANIITNDFNQINNGKSGIPGLSLRIEHRGGGSEYKDERIALEIEFFSDGLRDAWLTLDKERLEHRFQQLTLHSQLWQNQLQENLQRVSNTKALINSHVLAKKIAYYSGVLRQKEQQLEKGLIERSHLLAAQTLLKQTQLEQHFSSLQDIPLLPQSWVVLLNSIENFGIANVNVLQQYAQSHSTHLKLLATKQNQLDIKDSYLDDVSLKLFVENRNDQSVALLNENLIGLQLKLPLSFDFKAQDKQYFLKKQIALQEELTHRLINNNVSQLHNAFWQQQSELGTLLLKYEYLEQERLLVLRQFGASMAGLNYQPEQRMDEIELEKIQLEKQILIARLMVLSCLLQLQSVLETDNIELLRKI